MSRPSSVLPPPMPTVYIPSLMRKLTDGQAIVAVEGETIGQIVTHLETLFPGIRKRIIDEAENRVWPNIAVTVDGKIGRMGLREKVPPNSEIHFLPAIGGG